MPRFFFPPRPTGLQYGPAELGIDSADINTTSDVTGTVIDVSGFSKFTCAVVTTVVGTTPTAGDVNIELTMLAPGGTEVSPQIRLFDLIVRHAAGSGGAVISFPRRITATGGAATALITDTAVAEEGLQAIVAPRLVRLDVVNGVAHDAGTSAVISAYLWCLP